MSLPVMYANRSPLHCKKMIKNIRLKILEETVGNTEEVNLHYSFSAKSKLLALQKLINA